MITPFYTSPHTQANQLIVQATIFALPAPQPGHPMYNMPVPTPSMAQRATALRSAPPQDGAALAGAHAAQESVAALAHKVAGPEGVARPAAHLRRRQRRVRRDLGSQIQIHCGCRGYRPPRYQQCEPPVAVSVSPAGTLRRLTHRELAGAVARRSTRGPYVHDDGDGRERLSIARRAQRKHGILSAEVRAPVYQCVALWLFFSLDLRGKSVFCGVEKWFESITSAGSGPGQCLRRQGAVVWSRLNSVW